MVGGGLAQLDDERSGWWWGVGKGAHPLAMPYDVIREGRRLHGKPCMHMGVCENLCRASVGLGRLGGAGMGRVRGRGSGRVMRQD